MTSVGPLPFHIHSLNWENLLLTPYNIIDFLILSPFPPSSHTVTFHRRQHAPFSGRDRLLSVFHRKSVTGSNIIMVQTPLNTSPPSYTHVQGYSTNITKNLEIRTWMCLVWEAGGPRLFLILELGQYPRAPLGWRGLKDWPCRTEWLRVLAISPITSDD